MATHFNFISAKKRIELAKLEDSCAINPFDDNFKFKLKLDDVDISAIRFISEYLGYEPTNSIEQLISKNLLEAIKVTEFLEEKNFINLIKPKFDWNCGQKIKQIYKLNLVVEDSYFFNYVINKYPNLGFDANQTAQFAIQNYVQLFLDSFNEENYTPVIFPDKREARINAMKFGNNTLVDILNFSRDNIATAKLNFFGLSDTESDLSYNIGFYER